MNLIRYNPNRWLDSTFDRMFDNFFAPWPVSAQRAEEGGWAPHVDIRKQGDSIVIEADIPGVDRDSLKVEVKDSVLTLNGEKRSERREESEGVYRSERTFGAFTRKFSLPEEVDGDKIEAAYKDGVVTITLPLKPETAPKRIAVRTEGAGEARQISAS